MSGETWGAQRKYEGRREAQAENRSRLSHSYKRVITYGWGEMKLEVRIDFDVVYIEEPFMAHGCYVDGETLVEERFPRVTAMVTDYDRNPAGNYTGAWVAFVVDTMGAQLVPAAADPNYEIVHYFTFSGVALKNAPLYKIKG